ncbi:MAG: biotin transporter BioY [Oscillospiraceae bacterium]|nr:biotin transporter BioY [Oscillospiraceae bacterium]
MKKPLNIRELTLISIFTAVTAVFAQIAVLIPFSPVPISFGLVGVYITGILLRPKHAVFAQICYLLLGATGAPVFANFRGGVGALFGPTGGYLLVYPIMAWIVSMALNSRKSLQAECLQSKNKLIVKSGASICIAHIILYIGGTIWMSATTGNSIQAALALAVYPFILLDIIKVVFCVAAVVPLRTRLISMNFLHPDNTAHDS